MWSNHGGFDLIEPMKTRSSGRKPCDVVLSVKRRPKWPLELFLVAGIVWEDGEWGVACPTCRSCPIETVHGLSYRIPQTWSLAL